MKRGYENLKYEPRRRVHRNETRAWPVVKAALILLAVAAVLALAVKFGVPAVQRALHGDREAGDAAQLSHPNALVAPDGAGKLATAMPQTVLLSRPENIKALADPYVLDEQILFAAGPTLSSLTAILQVEPVTGACVELVTQRQFDTLRNPCGDSDYLVYADVKQDGGGAIRVLARETGETRELCTVAAGVPELCFCAPYLLVRERVGDGGVRLNLWDVSTGESAALALFYDSPFGTSSAWLSDNLVLYADASGKTDGTGLLCAVALPDGELTQFVPGTYVHDPKSSGNIVAWLAGNHGEKSDLYMRIGSGEQKRIARGAVDFSITNSCVVYNRDETVFACSFADDKTYVLSETGTNAQLAASSDALVLWRDVTDPAKPLWKYVWIG